MGLRNAGAFGWLSTIRGGIVTRQSRNIQRGKVQLDLAERDSTHDNLANPLFNFLW